MMLMFEKIKSRGGKIEKANRRIVETKLIVEEGKSALKGFAKQFIHSRR